MRRAVITGGQSGLGAACVTRLRADGVEVLTVDLAAYSASNVSTRAGYDISGGRATY